MPNKQIVALFVEGPTEIEFYKAVIKHAHDIMGTPFNCTFEWVDMRGIGNYKNDALRKFKTLQKKYPNDDLHVLLCIDTDAFQFSKNRQSTKQLSKNQ